MNRKIQLVAGLASVLLMSATYAEQYNYSVSVANRTNVILQASDGISSLGGIDSQNTTKFKIKDDGKSFDVKYNDVSVCYKVFDFTDALKNKKRDFAVVIAGTLKPGSKHVNCEIR